MPEKARIKVAVYLDADPGAGGQAHYALCLLDALRSHDDQFETIAYCSWRFWQDVCDDKGIAHQRIVPLRWDWGAKALAKVIRHFSQSQLAPAWYRALFARRVNKDSVDVCLFPVPTTLLTDVSIPTICAIHDLMYKYEREPYHEGKGRDYSYYDTLFQSDRYYETLYQSILSRATVVVTDAELGEQQIRESFSDIRAAIRILPFCAPRSTEAYDPQAEVSPAVRRAAQRPYLFYPAMHRPDKNHLALVRALRILEDQGLTCHAVFSGGFGPVTERINAEIERLRLRNSIIMLPYVTDEELCCLYAHAQALVMPTYAGPTNIPPLEAFALGCPVLISNIYAMPWQVGDAGILFDPDSPEEIAAAIREIWTCEPRRAELIEAGYRRSHELSFEVFAKGLTRIICEAHAS